MPLWFSLSLLVFGLAVGFLVGTVSQRRHLVGRLLRYLTRSTAPLRNLTLRPDQPPISLQVRSLPEASSWAGASSESDLQPCTYNLRAGPAEIALVLIDVWDQHPNRGWAERAEINIQNKLLPLLQVARDNNILISHCPNGRKIHHSIGPLPNELVLDGAGHRGRLIKTLKQSGVKYLLFAGYASNMCLLTRPAGMIEMHKAGFSPILVRDASIALESPELLHGELTHKVVTYMVETNWGMTTEVSDVVAALNRRPVEHPPFPSEDNPVRHPQALSGTHRDHPA